MQDIFLNFQEDREAVSAFSPTLPKATLGYASLVNGATLTGLRILDASYPGLPKRQPWAL